MEAIFAQVLRVVGLGGRVELVHLALALYGHHVVAVARLHQRQHLRHRQAQVDPSATPGHPRQVRDALEHLTRQTHRHHRIRPLLLGRPVLIRTHGHALSLLVNNVYR